MLNFRHKSKPGFVVKIWVNFAFTEISYSLKKRQNFARKKISKPKFSSPYHFCRKSQCLIITHLDYIQVFWVLPSAWPGGGWGCRWAGPPPPAAPPPTRPRPPYQLHLNVRYEIRFFKNGVYVKEGVKKIYFVQRCLKNIRRRKKL